MQLYRQQNEMITIWSFHKASPHSCSWNIWSCRYHVRLVRWSIREIQWIECEIQCRRRSMVGHPVWPMAYQPWELYGKSQAWVSFNLNQFRTSSIIDSRRNFRKVNQRSEPRWDDIMLLWPIAKGPLSVSYGPGLSVSQEAFQMMRDVGEKGRRWYTTTYSLWTDPYLAWSYSEKYIKIGRSTHPLFELCQHLWHAGFDFGGWPGCLQYLKLNIPFRSVSMLLCIWLCNCTLGVRIYWRVHDPDSH